MPEIQEAPIQETVKTPGNIVSAGQPTRATFPQGTSHPAPAPQQEPVVEDKAKEGQEGDAAPAPTTKQPDAPTVTTELSEDQLKAHFEKLGIKYEGVDKLKEKLSYTPPVEQTPEQKEQAAKDFEKRQFEVFATSGGTIEQFALLKNIANGDLKELSLAETINELKQASFNDDQIKQILAERYYQISDEDIDLADDDQKEVLRKKKEYGSKKLEGRAAHKQQYAKSFFESLTKTVQEADAEKANMELHSSKVGEAIKSYQRTETFQLEDGDGQETFPVEFTIPDSALNEVQTIIGDAKEFEKKFYNEDGSINTDFLLPIFVKAYSRDEAVKDAFKKGQSREVEKIQGTFGPTPPTLGGAKKTTGTPGNIVSAGQPEVMKRPT